MVRKKTWGTSIRESLQIKRETSGTWVAPRKRTNCIVGPWGICHLTLNLKSDFSSIFKKWYLDCCPGELIMVPVFLLTHNNSFLIIEKMVAKRFHEWGMKFWNNENHTWFKVLHNPIFTTKLIKILNTLWKMQHVTKVRW